VSSFPAPLLAALVDRINVGVVTLGPGLVVLQWNRFMETHSGQPAGAVVGHELFTRFPELPRDWLESKIRGTFARRTPGFCSWRNRASLFPFVHRTPAGERVPMRQDCAFIPLAAGGGEGDEVEAVALVIIDASDTYQTQRRLDAALADLAALSDRDGLTGVYNRRKLDQILQTEFERAGRYGGMVSVVLVDIDHLQRINDQQGHLIGDETLRHVARTAQATLRTTDTLARYGGEELIAVLPEVGLEGAIAAGERIRVGVAESPVIGSPRPFNATVSVGVATFHPALTTPPALVDEADQALHRAKLAGRNQVRAFLAPG
jgi:diguanylate cyclase (GGDEF)-like protein